MADRSVPVDITLSDLEMQDARNKMFPADFLNNVRWCRPFDIERPTSAW